MNRLEIPYFHNVMLDNGTVALHRYLVRNRNELKMQDYECSFVADNQLVIQSDKLFELLEEVYYLMGREIYDTYTNKQRDEAGNLYFVQNKETLTYQAFPFAKMNTYGLTELLTNNAQGTTVLESNTRKIANIEKDDPVLANQIKAAFEKKGIKLLSKVYFEEPYTKITRLEKPELAHFIEGKYQCTFTGLSRKKVVDAQNTSAFLSGISSFNSFLSNSDKKVSWLAMYLSRFAAANCLYVYEIPQRERIMAYLFHANNLQNLSSLWWSNRVGTLDIDTLRISGFMRNFEVQPAFSSKSFDLQLTNDNLLGILYTLQRRALTEPVSFANDPLDDDVSTAKNYSLMSFRADAFASTKRPNRTEYIDDLTPLLRFINFIEEQGLVWKDILDSLKIIKPSLESNKKSNRLEREFREMLLGKIFKIQPIHGDMADFFVDCFAYKLDGQNTYRSYNDLLKFTTYYENKRTMDNQELKQRRDAAIALGKSIGIAIINWSKNDGQAPDQKANAKQGRKFVIVLRKARTFDKFMEAITRLQSRFQFGISIDEKLDLLTDENFKEYRDFAIIQATNILISAYKNEKIQPS
jgi:hypothetical protein